MIRQRFANFFDDSLGMSLVERVSYNSVIIQRDPLLALFTLDLRNTLSWCTYGASFQRALVVPGTQVSWL